MVERGFLGKGEEKFIRTFEKIHKEKPYLYEKKPEERVKHIIEEIKVQISDLPEIKREVEFHQNIPVQQVTNVLAQAIQLAIEEGVEEGLKFIYQTKNPYLIDAFHDILIGHFIGLVKNK